MTPSRKYYDYSVIRSHNAVYNLIPGTRGLGKTFGFKEMAIADAINKDEEFIYLRRYKTELAAARDSFFSDIAVKFPGWEFRISGSRAQMRKFVDPDKFESEEDFNKASKKARWKTIGYFVSLSTAQKQRSVSYPKVTKIGYDEFIIEKGALHYLPNEVDAFNNFYVTVDRFQDRVKVFFLANSISIMNPYFMAWNILPEEGKEFIKREKGFIVAHFPDATEFSKDIYTTRFGQFIKNTEFADTAVANQFHDNNDKLVIVKGYKHKYKFSLETEYGNFSVWYDVVSNGYHVSSKDIKSPTVYTLVMENMDSHKILMTVRDKPLAYLRSAFNNGRVTFDKPQTRNAFRGIFKR